MPALLERVTENEPRLRLLWLVLAIRQRHLACPVVVALFPQQHDPLPHPLTLCMTRTEGLLEADQRASHIALGKQHTRSLDKRPTVARIELKSPVRRLFCNIDPAAHPAKLGPQRPGLGIRALRRNLRRDQLD